MRFLRDWRKFGSGWEIIRGSLGPEKKTNFFDQIPNNKGMNRIEANGEILNGMKFFADSNNNSTNKMHKFVVWKTRFGIYETVTNGDNPEMFNTRDFYKTLRKLSLSHSMRL